MAVLQNNTNAFKVLDLNFQGIQGTIAVYLIEHTHGAILIETGPGSTTQEITTQLAKYHLKPTDITDVFLTHIHLDHAGAAGWFARQGAHIYVHPFGAPHLLNPERLIASATRIYGDMMQELWGDFLPVPENQLSVLNDGDTVDIGKIHIKVLDTPGHANHHLVYFIDNVCFSGDICGVRLSGPPHISLPLPPPEFNLEKWKHSIQKIQTVDFLRIAPTHFGIYPDRDWHLSNVAKQLDELELWLNTIMSGNQTLEFFNQQYIKWVKEVAQKDRLDSYLTNAYEKVNPTWMSSQGLFRYWQKYRA